MIPRGLRNNNPFNIKISNSRWYGKLPKSKNTDGVFEQFYQLYYGLRAGARLLRNYIVRSGLHTLPQIISRFAPSSENDTNEYIAFVERYIKKELFYYDIRDRIVPDTMPFYLMCMAIIKYESGLDITYSDLKLAFDS